MKRKGFTASESLGLKQFELALLLRVNRSQIAMYETGKRELPSAASTLLFEILAQVEPAKQLSKNKPDARDAAAKQNQIQKLLNDNTFQQMKVSRKIAVASKKHELQRNAAIFAGVLKHAEAIKPFESLREYVNLMGLESKTIKNSEGLIALQIKLDLLINEQKWLESQLKVLPKK